MYCMVKYTPDEVDEIIKVLKKVRPKGMKVEKTIAYLEQRHKFFNPNKDMLEYLISHERKFKANKEVLLKLKTDLTKKSGS